MIVTDLVCEQIHEHLASHPPERGGALYGPTGYPVVTHFEFDEDGETSAVSYVPSTRLIGNVGKVERGTGLQLKGIIHSHPTGLTRPSEGDKRTAESFFRLNPHFSVLAMPIVQTDRSLLRDEASFIHWYRVERRSDVRRGCMRSIYSWPENRNSRSDTGELGEVRVEVIKDDFHLIPIWRDVGTILARLQSGGLELTASKRVQHVRIRNALLIELTSSDGAGHEFMYFVSFDYPVVAPIILYQEDGATKSLPIKWEGLQTHEESVKRIGDLLLDHWKR